jgi:hypothetical protein
MIYIFVLVCLLFAYAYAQDKCPNHPGYVPVQKDLSFCPQYSSGPSCCTQDDDNQLRNRYGSLTAVFTGNCLENLKTLFCAWTCDPNQVDFMNTTIAPSNKNPSLNVTHLFIYWNNDTANALYATCKDECYLLSKTQPWSEVKTTPASFIEYFTSTSDPSYTPSATLPVTWFYVAADPSAGLKVDGLKPKDDANKCPKATPSISSTITTTTTIGTTGNSAATSLSLTPLFGLASLFLSLLFF